MRAEGAEQVVVAVPVSSTDALILLEEAADEVVCLYSPEDFFGVGQFYSHFGQTDDQEVVELLKASREER
jgi:predicted phosphoribosyltransferase